MDDIVAISTSCASCFDNLAQSLRTSSDEFKKQMPPIVIENEFARFKIWAGNLGALQRGRISLDARLRDSVVLRAAVVKFLRQLQDSLGNSAEIITGLRLPYEQAEDIPSGGDEDFEDGSGSSDSSDIDTTELAERLDEIKDIMEHLYRLSFKIRNTKDRSLTKKALLMKQQDPQTGKDLFSSYAAFDLRHVQEFLHHLRFPPSSNEFTTEQVRDPNGELFDILEDSNHLLYIDDFLRDRLARAITNRRRYFAYWRRHSLKLSRVTDEQTNSQIFTTPVRPAQPISSPSILVPAPVNVKPATGPVTTMSGTEFSMYNRELDDQLDADTVISYATTAYDVNGKSPEFPPPPPDAASKSEFICPYCWVACPSRQGKQKQWREHIRQDLQPYVCTYEECPDADRMYASRHAWIEHERLVHCRIWRCFEHRNFISASKLSLEEHFLDCHKDLDRQQIENLIDLAETTVADDRQTCPFCYSIGPFEKGFYNHMAYHQEQLATFAVSRNLDSNEEADSGKAGGIISAGTLHSVSLHFTNDDSSLESNDSELSISKVGNPLLQAVFAGDEALVKLLLDRGANVNTQDKEYSSVLQAASSQGHERIVQILLDRGADINAQSGLNGSALQTASYEGYEKIVQILLDRGADINAQSCRSALQEASSKGHEKIVQILLDRGADINSQSGPYGSALQAASYEGYENIVHILLDWGADINTQDKEYGSALQEASSQGYERIVQILLDRGADINAQSGPYGSALQAASSQGHEKIVQILLDRGADINSQGGLYGSALQVALDQGHENIVHILLDRGADINAQGGPYSSALQSVPSPAAFQSRKKLLQILLDRSADINAQSSLHGSALQEASSQGEEKIVQILLDRGADINAQGGPYGSALQAASYEGEEKIVQILLDRGADINTQDKEYGSALQAASSQGYERIVHILLDRGADINAQGGLYGSALQAASSHGRKKIVQILLDRGADINAQGGLYGSALQAASDQGHEKIVHILLDRGADINTQGGPYGSALQAASSQGEEKIVQILLDRGADINAQGGLYGSALQAASDQGEEKIVQILLDRGADINAHGGALKAASYRDHEKVMQMLIDRGAGVYTDSGALDTQSTFDTVSKLGRLYDNQGKLGEALEMYKRAMAGYEKTLGPDNNKTQEVLDRINELSNLFGEVK